MNNIFVGMESDYPTVYAKEGFSDEHVYEVERKGFCKIGYTRRDLEKIAFLFQNKSIFSIIKTWVKFRFKRKAYE